MKKLTLKNVLGILATWLIFSPFLIPFGDFFGVDLSREVGLSILFTLLAVFAAWNEYSERVGYANSDRN